MFNFFGSLLFSTLFMSNAYGQVGLCIDGLKMSTQVFDTERVLEIVSLSSSEIIGTIDGERVLTTIQPSAEVPSALSVEFNTAPSYGTIGKYSLLIDPNTSSVLKVKYAIYDDIDFGPQGFGPTDVFETINFSILTSGSCNVIY